MDIRNIIKTGVSDGSAIIMIETGILSNNQLFECRSICGFHDNQAITEVAEFYMTSEGNPHYFDSALPKATATIACVRDTFYVPAGYSLGVRFPSAANTERMYLYVSGLFILKYTPKKLKSK